jgi:hypothetical protein
MVFLNNQCMGDIPSECEMETRALIRLASCCVRIQQGVAPNRPGTHLPRNGGIAPATDSIVLIARPCVDDTPWKYSVGSPTACRALR